MKRVVLLSEEAEADLDSAYTWYEEQLTGLGEELIEELIDALRHVAENPFSFQVIYRDFHHLPLKRFPFVILYKLKNDEVSVYRIFHTSRDPIVWREP